MTVLREGLETTRHLGGHIASEAVLNGPRQILLKASLFTECVEPSKSSGCPVKEPGALLKGLNGSVFSLSRDVCGQGSGPLLFSPAPHSPPPDRNELFASPPKEQSSWLLELVLWATRSLQPCHSGDLYFSSFFYPTSILRDKHMKGKVTEVLRTMQEAQPQTLPQIHSSNRGQSAAHPSSSSTSLLHEEPEACPSVDVTGEYPDRVQLLGARSFVYTKSRCLCSQALQIHPEVPGEHRPRTQFQA